LCELARGFYERIDLVPDSQTPWGLVSLTQEPDRTYHGNDAVVSFTEAN